MSKIKHITISVKYKVGYRDIENVPTEALKELQRASENCDEITFDNGKYLNAIKWLQSQVCERDCVEWACEIDEIE